MRNLLAMMLVVALLALLNACAGVDSEDSSSASEEGLYRLELRINGGVNPGVGTIVIPKDQDGKVYPNGIITYTDPDETICFNILFKDGKWASDGVRINYQLAVRKDSKTKNLTECAEMYISEVDHLGELGIASNTHWIVFVPSELFEHNTAEEEDESDPDVRVIEEEIPTERVAWTQPADQVRRYIYRLEGDDLNLYRPPVDVLNNRMNQSQRATWAHWILLKFEGRLTEDEEATYTRMID